jgi:hypothetical protein
VGEILILLFFEQVHTIVGTLKGNFVLDIWCVMGNFVDDMSKSLFLFYPTS